MLLAQPSLPHQQRKQRIEIIPLGSESQKLRQDWTARVLTSTLVLSLQSRLAGPVSALSLVVNGD